MTTPERDLELLRCPSGCADPGCYSRGGFYSVSCICQWRGPEYKTQKQAIDAWNRRAETGINRELLYALERIKNAHHWPLFRDDAEKLDQCVIIASASVAKAKAPPVEPEEIEGLSEAIAIATELHPEGTFLDGRFGNPTCKESLQVGKESLPALRAQTEADLWPRNVICYYPAGRMSKLEVCTKLFEKNWPHAIYDRRGLPDPEKDPIGHALLTLEKHGYKTEVNVHISAFTESAGVDVEALKTELSGKFPMLTPVDVIDELSRRGMLKVGK